jgi:curved DNA-binding protein CbpA
MGNQESVPSHYQRPPPVSQMKPRTKPTPRSRNNTGVQQNGFIPERVEKVEYMTREQLAQKRMEEDFLQQQRYHQQRLQQQQEYERTMQQQQQQQQQYQQPPRRMEDIMMERGRMEIQQKNQFQQQYGGEHPSFYKREQEQPERNMQIMKRDMETLNLTPYRFQDEIEEYQKQQEDERIAFEEEERKRRKEFDEYSKKKNEYLQREIQRFEENYNPFEILELPSNHYVTTDIKKAYKRLALKYHPDKAGPQYANQFQLITQAYIYLLNKCEEKKHIEERMTTKVSKREYVDDVNDSSVQNIYINKDKFDIQNFNKIFEEHHLQEDENEGGYGELYKQNDGDVGDHKIFNTKFSKDIFNANFDSIKQNKNTSQEVIQYYEPEALISSNVGFQELGKGRVKDYSGNSSLSYTDYKRAHLEDNVLIDASKVKYKEYKNLDQLKMDRENLSYQATHEDSLRYKAYERMREEKERERLEKLREQEERHERQFRKINQKLIVHHK